MSFTDTEVPEQKYLDRYVKEKVCASRFRKWKDLGSQLLDEDDLSAVTARTYNMDELQACSEMFNIWRERQPKASWQQLIKALKIIKLERLANKIESLLIQSHQDGGKRIL